MFKVRSPKCIMLLIRKLVLMPDTVALIASLYLDSNGVYSISVRDLR